MATAYLGMNRGQHETDVTSGTSDPGTDLKITIDTSKNITREEFIRYLQMIINAAIKGNWPLA